MHLYKSVTKVGIIFQLCKKNLIFFIKNLVFLFFCPIFGLPEVFFAYFALFCAPDRTRTCTSQDTRS